MGRSGNQLGRTVPGTVYPCAPGGPNDYVYIFAQPQMWKPLVNAMGRPDLADDPLFATAEARWENRDAFAQIMSSWTMQRSKFDVMKVLGDAGVPCGACQDTGEILEDPHLIAREMIVDVDYPTRGTYQTVGSPLKLSDSPVEVTRPPLLGEHSVDLLAELCGVGAEEAKAFLKDLGVDDSGVSALIKGAYDLLGLQTYFTAGEKEVRAWTIKKGWKAPQAAGVIHTDFEKGFIRAEVISFDDFIACRGEHGAKEAGKMRLEGRDYVVKDGDVMHFRFNV